MSIKKTNKIIVVGAGYAGLRTVEMLACNPNNEIMLFDKNSFHFMQTDVYDLIANEDDFAGVSVDLTTFALGFDGNVVFCKQEVKNIDFQNKKVITQTQRYIYDYLVICVGSRTKFLSNIKGLKEFAYGVKALHRAMYFKQKFEMSLFNKVNESGTQCKPINIVVTGAGLSGVEIAAQMASYSKHFFKKNNFICRKLNIVIVNSAKNILRGMDPYLIKRSQKRLNDLEIIVKHEKRVVGLTRESVELSDGEILPMDFMIYAGGIEPNALVYQLDIEKNENQFIKTNEYLQTIEYKEVFAIGDCTNISKNGKIVPPTADIAEQMGELCAKNIENIIANKELKKHNIRSRGVLIALGNGYAVAKLFNIRFSGYFAYIIKKIVEKVYFKRLDHRSNIGYKRIFGS
jgi:NADH dehydrogenase